MSKAAPLSSWLGSRAENLDRATLGQLVTLMNLVTAPSVAEVGRRFGRAKKMADAGVNARQKLARLEAALKVGKLTRREGKYVRPTAAGIRVAAEIRLFLQELHAMTTGGATAPRWVIGAGDSWLQCAILPALALIGTKAPGWSWEVRNLRADEIRSGLRDGLLHFGFLREAELGPRSPFSVVTRVSLESYRIIVGDAVAAPKTAKELFRWAVQQHRPLAQQGSTWRPMHEKIGHALELGRQLDAVDIHLVCQTHGQAISAVMAGNGWCVVPSGLGRVLPAGCRSALVPVEKDSLVLAYYDRALNKQDGSAAVRDVLLHAIRDVAKTF